MRAGRKKSLIGSEKTTYLMRSFYFVKFAKIKIYAIITLKFFDE